MMPPVAEWGRRLSDAVRAALDAGDFATARRLALEGDGQARSLAKEYALMYRGLGITLRVLLPLLRATAPRAAAPDEKTARAELVDLLRRFRRDMSELMAQASGTAEAATVFEDDPGTLDEEVARTERFLDASEDRFDREQAHMAREVVSAIAAGDGARARALVDAKEQGQYVPLHDRLIRFMAESFGWVLRRYGPAELLRFHLATAEGQRRGFEKWEQMAPEEFARVTAFLLKQHMGQVEVREDAERFTIEQAPCGSGGRLRLAGAYDGPGALPVVEFAGPLTFGQPRLPVYCSHCPVWNAVATIRWFGRPHWVFENASRPDGSCTLHVYKRRDGAPREYVDRLTVPEERA
ncbi:MAG: hypothetical protein ACRELA_18405 [Candidatus Rokuibacteriota bacterium]